MRADLRVRLPVSGARLSLWRAVAAFRVATLVVAVFLIVLWQPIYRRPGVALGVGLAMTISTAIIYRLAVRGRAHRLTVVAIDIVATAVLTLLTVGAQTTAQQHGGMVTLTTIWAAGPTIEAAFVAGPVGGVLAAALQYAATVVVADAWQGRTLYSGVLLLVTGLIVGFVAQLVVRAEAELRVAAAAQAAVAERERLARSIHDGVLQVLGLVHRAGREAGGEWATLATAAAEQEVALRGLISTQSSVPPPSGRHDLAEDLRRLSSLRVTVSTPAEPVALDAVTAIGVDEAVRAALQNVEAHAGPGAHAWVLLETTYGQVRVTVRDDGVGMAAGRLAEAELEGRLGVARSLRGRIADLGGLCTITSTPGEGTVVDIAVPFR